MNHHRKILRRSVWLLPLLLSAAGPVACGMRGDLYLPQEEPPAAVQAAGTGGATAEEITPADNMADKTDSE